MSNDLTPETFVPIPVPPPVDPTPNLADEPKVGPGKWWRNSDEDAQRGLFMLTGAQPIVDDRCDKGAIGPYGFHRWNEDTQLCSCGLDTAPNPGTANHDLSLASLSYIDIVYESYPHGYICYYECPTKADEEASLNTTLCPAPTLQELFRLMVEWDIAYTDFGSTEPVAETSHLILEEMELPANLRAWLMSDVKPQRVERFLRGDPHARRRAGGVVPMEGEFGRWISGKVLLNERTFGKHRVGG